MGAKGVVPLPPALLLASLRLVSLSERPEEMADNEIDVPWDRYTLMRNVRRKKAAGENTPRGGPSPSGAMGGHSHQQKGLQLPKRGRQCDLHHSSFSSAHSAMISVSSCRQSIQRPQERAGTLIKGDQNEPSESQTCWAGWP